MKIYIKVILFIYTFVVVIVSIAASIALIPGEKVGVQGEGWCTDQANCLSKRWGQCANGGYTNDVIWTRNDTYCGRNEQSPQGICQINVNTCYSNVQRCEVGFGGGVTGCISVSPVCAETFTFQKHIKFVGNTKSDGSDWTNGDCVGTHAPSGNITLKAGDHVCPSNGAPCGHCVQYDGPQGGVAQYTGKCDEPVKPTDKDLLCNEVCNPNNDKCDKSKGHKCLNINGSYLCRLQSNPESATCSEKPPVVKNPNIKIEKYVLGGQIYFIGEVAEFKIKITNIGETVLNQVRFTDKYNSSYLRYLSGSLEKSSGQTISNIDPFLNIKSAGILRINNLALTSVGGLNVNEYYILTLKFLVLAPINTTCNVGYALIPERPEMQDDACIGAQNRDTDL